MKRLLTALLATALATPAVAQHGGHHMPGHSMPMPKAKPKPAPKKPAAKPKAPARPAAKAKATTAAKRAPAKKAPVRKALPKPAPKRAAAVADPHAGHSMALPAQPAADPHASHQMPAEETAASDPHAGHSMPAAPAPPIASPPPGAFGGPEHAADLVHGAANMAASRAELRDMHGAMKHSKILIDRLEARIRDGRDGYAWDGQGWYGGDIDKLWIKTEGEGAFGEALEKVEVQALWSHAIDPWFDLQAGLRYNFRPDPERAYLALGVQGLAPYWFEVDAAAFVSNKGDVSARVEAEYDLRLTQKLILQPRVEFDLALQNVPELGIGSGLSSGEIGARLRYEVRPEFAPYVGIEYERAFGDTADFRRLAGEDAGGWSFLVGLRTWF